MSKYKHQVVPERGGEPVGEAWEISVEPDFPSRIAGTDQPLAELLAQAPEAYLGAEAEAGRSSTALLVKLLDAGANLSLQIHPSDEYGALGRTQAGKPESWYVLEADAGAGVFLGLKDGVDRAEMSEALQNEADVAALLQFVPVQTGDFILVEAGVPHAVGQGVTLVEPQHVLPGRHGVTYRYWDWNRRYNAEGHFDPAGQARELHVEHALAVTEWQRAQASRYLKQAFFRAGLPHLTQPATTELLCSRQEAQLQSRWLRVARLVGTGKVAVPRWSRLQGLTVVAGTVTVRGSDFELEVSCGHSAILPAALPAVTAELAAGHAILSSVEIP